MLEYTCLPFYWVEIICFLRCQNILIRKELREHHPLSIFSLMCISVAYALPFLEVLPQKQVTHKKLGPPLETSSLVLRDQGHLEKVDMGRPKSTTKAGKVDLNFAPPPTKCSVTTPHHVLSLAAKTAYTRQK